MAGSKPFAIGGKDVHYSLLDAFRDNSLDIFFVQTLILTLDILIELGEIFVNQALINHKF